MGSFVNLITSVCKRVTFGIQELEAAAGECNKSVEKDAAVAAAQAAVAAGALAGPGEKDKAAAVLAGVDKASGLTGVEKVTTVCEGVVSDFPGGARVDKATAAFSGVDATASRRADEAAGFRQVFLCLSKDVCFGLPFSVHI